MFNFSSLAEKQKHWLQETLILMLFEIKSLAATEVPFSLSKANCSVSTASCSELKLHDALRDSENLRVRAHKKLDGSTGLLELEFIFISRVIGLGSGDKDGGSDGTLF